MAINLSQAKGALPRKARQEKKALSTHSRLPQLDLPWKGATSSFANPTGLDMMERELRLNRSLGLDFSSTSRIKLPQNIDSASSLYWCLEIHKHLKKQAKSKLLKLF